MMRRQQGMTIVELMIAMVIGLIVTGAAIALFVASSQTHRSTTQVATMLDNARLAVTFLERDIQHAGYLGYLSSPILMRGRADTTDEMFSGLAGLGTCDSKTDIRMQIPIEVIDNVTYGSCLQGYVNGTDVLVTRRLTTGTPAAGPLQNDVLYARVDHRFGQLFLGGVPPTAAFAAPNETRTVQVAIYYVSNVSEDPGVASALRRISLGPGPALVDEELVPGVEDLQVEYGVDEDLDGSVNAYVAPFASPALADVLRAVRVSLLLHSNQLDVQYKDTGDYLLLGPAQPRFAFDAPRRRTQYTRTVYLRN